MTVYWKPQDDPATLCEECALREINRFPTVRLGLVPVRERVQEIVDFFAAHGHPDYFTSSETGTCADCGVSSEQEATA